MRLLFVDAAIYRHRLPEPIRTVDHLRRVAASLVVERRTKSPLPRGKVAFSRGLLIVASGARQLGHSVEYVHHIAETHTSLRQKLRSVDGVALYAMTPTIHACLGIARLAKKMNSSCRVSVGGPHSISRKAELLAMDCIDAVGDQFADLATNIAAVTGEEPAKSQILAVDDLGWSNPPEQALNHGYTELVDYSVLPLSPDSYYYNISTSRGCAYSCRYCSDGIGSVNVRSLPDLYRELHILDTLMPNGSWVHFFDSIFTVPRRRALSILTWIATNTKNLIFSCDIKANHVDAEIARALHAARVRLISIGFETSSQQSLALAAKRNSIEDCWRTAALLRSHMPDCAIKAYWLLGLPGSSGLTMDSDLEMINRLLTQEVVDIVGPKFFVPYPETQFFAEPERFGLQIRSRNWALYDRFHTPPVCHPIGLSPGELESSLFKVERLILDAYCRKLGVREQELSAIEVPAAGYNGELYWRTV